MNAILVDAGVVKERPEQLGEFLAWLNRQNARYRCYLLDRGGLPTFQENVATVIPFPDCTNSGCVAESGLIQRIMTQYGIRIFVQTGKAEPLAAPVIRLQLGQQGNDARPEGAADGLALPEQVVVSAKDDKFDEMVKLLLRLTDSSAGREFFAEWQRLRRIEAEIGDG